MKLIIFDGTFKTTAFINRLIEGLVSSGVDVYVLGFNEDLKQPLKNVKYVSLGSSQSRFKFALTSLKCGFRSKAILKTISLLLKGDKSELKKNNLSIALKAIQPDIVHLQWVSNIKLFEDFLEEKKHKFILSQRGYQTNVRPFVNTENYAYLQKMLPKFDGFHSVSKAISKVGDRIYAHPNKIDQVVYTGIDLSKFEYQPQVVKNEILHIISVGRPHWIKGYEYALKACALLNKQGIDFKYTIIGAAGDEELLFLIDDLGLQDKVELTSKLPQANVFELMKGSDLFLLPSLEEGIANVAVEAMALGCPVISSDCGGMQELITHGKEGWIVPKRDVQTMADQILEFSQMESCEISKIKKQARLKVEQQHTEEQMVEGMVRLYSRVVG
jgi:colanic acid/amylovoran biosynthesis glycosyltransferase